MNQIVYYVAVSLDGYIAGPDGDISAFIQSGEAVDLYFSDLQKFRTVIMGRGTYEFGYRFGLQPGKPAYPHMEHYLFSRSLKLDDPDPAVHVVDYDIGIVEQIRKDSDSDIYLCGGGVFAGWLLQNNRIDCLKLKVNPITLGGGTRLFGDAPLTRKWKLESSRTFEGGLQFQTYRPQAV